MAGSSVMLVWSRLEGFLTQPSPFGYNDDHSMGSIRLRTTPHATGVWLAVFWGAICAGFLSAPLLQAYGNSDSAALLYSFFSSVCHQDPTRSFSLLGHACAVCHRCAGIYVGLFLVSLIPDLAGELILVPHRRRCWVACATAPMLLDVFLPLAGFWTSTAISRFVTGWLFGAMLASLLKPALAELLWEVARARGRLHGNPRGGMV